MDLHGQFVGKLPPKRTTPSSSRSIDLPAGVGEITAVLILLEQSFTAKLCRLEAAEFRLRRMARRAERASARKALRRLESERQGVARELHTGVGQLLAAIRIQVEIAGQHLPAESRELGAALERIGALAGESLDVVRGLSHGLYVPAWQTLPLDRALAELWERSGVEQRFAGGLRFGTLPGDPDPETKALLYRAAQEGIANALRHSQASRVDLALEAAGERLKLTVEDNGVGFDSGRSTVARGAASGIGLSTLRDQAAVLGGKLLVESGASGTRLEILVPLPC